MNEEKLLTKYKAIALFGKSNIEYFSGFTGEGICAFVGNEKFIITDFRYEEAAHKNNEYQIIINNDYLKALINLCDDKNVKSLNIDGKNINSVDFSRIIDEKICVGFIDEDILSIRMIKNDSEIEIINEGAKLNDKYFDRLVKLIKPGVSEKDMYCELVYMMNKDGCDKAFEPIIASGENSSMPHAVVSNRKFKSGDLITMDYGVKIKGYCSDFTRTVAVGEIDDRRKKVYNIVKSANERAFESFIYGMNAVELDRVARDYIAEFGYEKQFGHGLGHGVGMDIHEEPRVSLNGKYQLLNNMVFTIEPGIYISGEFGVRIEDLCIIKNGNIERLSVAIRDLIVV